jgi:hypothetical protein
MLNVQSPITQSTRLTYDRIAKMLGRRALARHRNDPTPLDPNSATALALEYGRAESQISAASARMYYAAVLWRMRSGNFAVDDVDLAMTLLEGQDELDVVSRQDTIREIRSDREKHFRRGSQQKALTLSFADTCRLLDALRTSGTLHGSQAADWFASTLLTGLRPGEWRTAKLVGSTLVVENAKRTQNRSFGPIRTLHLQDLLPAERTCIDRHIAAVPGAGSPSSFSSFYNSCRDILRRTSDSLWPKRLLHPSLYTARHMFAAAAKSTWPPDRVAALMGHGSIRSAPEYYSAGRHAHGTIAVSPDWDNVLAVRARNALQYLEKQEAKSTRS